MGNRKQLTSPGQSFEQKYNWKKLVSSVLPKKGPEKKVVKR